MSGTTDKIKGAANEAMGNVKQTIGRLAGSDKLEAEGLMQEAKGNVQSASGAVKDNVKHAANKATDAINKRI